MISNDVLEDVSEIENILEEIKELKDDCVCDTYKHKKRTDNAVLDVIAVVSNPVRFKRRYQLFNEFCERMKLNPKVRLTTVEAQQRARPFQTDATLKFKVKDELWYKENLMNIAVQHLPCDWEYVAFIDADIEFQNENWAQDTIEQLQTYKIVQLFSHAIDSGPEGQVMSIHSGFSYLYVNGEEWKPASYGGKFMFPGYGWGFRRGVFEAIGGLIDYAILGSADHHMALAFIGLVENSLNHNLNKNYKELVRIFQERCEMHVKRDIGYVPGTVRHFFHSCKSRRFYKDRWVILTSNDFDPLRDIKKDSHGLWQLEDNKPKLRDDLRKYFRERKEDSTDLYQDYQFMKKNYI